jgi:hypothetical protein
MAVPGQSNDFTTTVPVAKSYENHKVKRQLFIYLPLGFVLGFEEGRSRNFSKNPKIDEVIEGEIFIHFGL